MYRILCENIRSTFNVGSLFRIADAIGNCEILLVGYTPSPIDRMGRKNERIQKTALGAEESVQWFQYETTAHALQAYPNMTPVVVEQTDRAVQYVDFTPPEDTLFIFGNELSGVAKETQEMVSHHIALPMQGEKESLNVAVCAAVICYHYRKNN